MGGETEKKILDALAESYIILVDIRNILTEILKQLTPEEGPKLENVSEEITKEEFRNNRCIIRILSKNQEWLKLRTWDAIKSLSLDTVKGISIMRGREGYPIPLPIIYGLPLELYLTHVDYVETEEKVIFYGQVMEEQALKERIKIESI